MCTTFDVGRVSEGSTRINWPKVTTYSSTCRSRILVPQNHSVYLEQINNYRSENIHCLPLISLPSSKDNELLEGKLAVSGHYTRWNNLHPVFAKHSPTSYIIANLLSKLTIIRCSNTCNMQDKRLNFACLDTSVINARVAHTSPG